LESLIREAAKAGALPRKISALCEVVRELGNVGAHPIPDEEKVSHREAQLATTALLLIFEWYNRAGGTPEQRRAQVRARTLDRLRVSLDAVSLFGDSAAHQKLRQVIADCIDHDQVKLAQPERDELVEDIHREIAANPAWFARPIEESNTAPGSHRVRGPDKEGSPPERRIPWARWLLAGVALLELAGLVGYWIFRP
jgi:hypothetical protein